MKAVDSPRKETPFSRFGSGSRNISEVYEQATIEELETGFSWYRHAHRQAERLALKYDLPLDRVTSVIAVLSPGSTWQRNVEDAEALLRESKLEYGRPSNLTLSSYGLNKKKAWKLARGGDRSLWLKGLKVGSFYQNILWPDTSREVTVDGHSYSIWVGERHGLQSHNGAGELPTIPSRIYRNPTYGRIAEDYKRVADTLNLKPHQVQAVCWLTWRRLQEVRLRKGEERLYQLLEEAA